MAKPIEMYTRYVSGPLWEKDQAVISVEDLRFLVKKAGLFIHPPDEGTGVVVINQSKTRKSSEVL